MRLTELKPGMDVAYFHVPPRTGEDLFRAALDSGGLHVYRATVTGVFAVTAYEGQRITVHLKAGLSSYTTTDLDALLCPWPEFEEALKARKLEIQERQRKEREADRDRARRWTAISPTFSRAGVPIDYDAFGDTAELDIEMLEALASRLSND